MPLYGKHSFAQNMDNATHYLTIIIKIVGCFFSRLEFSYLEGYK